MRMKKWMASLTFLSVLTALIFIIDLYFPRGLSFGVLYSIPIFLTHFAGRKRYAFIFACVATLFIIIDFFFSPWWGTPFLIVAGNRVLSVFVVWLIAFSSMRRIRTEVML